MVENRAFSLGDFKIKEHKTQFCMPLSPVFSRNYGKRLNFMGEPMNGLNNHGVEDIRDLLLSLKEKKGRRLCSPAIAWRISTFCVIRSIRWKRVFWRRGAFDCAQGFLHPAFSKSSGCQKPDAVQSGDIPPFFLPLCAKYGIIHLIIIHYGRVPFARDAFCRPTPVYRAAAADYAGA